MHKMCPRCGIVFEVKGDPAYCSERCRKLFQQSSWDAVRGRREGRRGIVSGSGEDTEVIRPRAAGR